jgi:hypothetical protein
MANIGDMVPRTGIYTNPGVITEKKPDGTVTVNTEPMALNKYHRHANTTGLSEPEKAKFNDILDKVYTKENDVDKINDIQKAIDGLKTDPLNRNIVQYLRNQQSHLVRSAEKLPQQYTTDEASIRS